MLFSAQLTQPSEDDGVEVHRRFDIEAVLRDLLQKRNHSILAHSLEPIGKGPAFRFLEYVGAMLETSETRVGAEHARLRGL